LERNDLRPALVLQHFGRNGGAGNRRRTEHGRLTANQQDFAQLYDRPDVAGDLAYLEHIIRNDAVLPAAGFDDCEHRYIPSCSIPASNCSGPAFWSVVMGSISALRAKTNSARKIPRRVGRTYSRWKA